MSLFDSGNWSHELERQRREREILELDAQNRLGPIRAIDQLVDRDLLAIINRTNVAVTTKAK